MLHLVTHLYWPAYEEYITAQEWKIDIKILSEKAAYKYKSEL